MRQNGCPANLDTYLAALRAMTPAVRHGATGNFLDWGIYLHLHLPNHEHPNVSAQVHLAKTIV
jgi:hypothetical protein